MGIGMDEARSRTDEAETRMDEVQARTDEARMAETTEEESVV